MVIIEILLWLWGGMLLLTTICVGMLLATVGFIFLSALFSRY